MDLSIVTYNEFKKFFEEFFPAVHSFLLGYTKDEELSYDIAQETFIKIYEDRERIRDIKHSRALLYTIARRIYWNHLKHEKIKENYHINYLAEERDDYDFHEELTRQESIRIFYSAIDKLPPQGRRIILLNLKGKNNMEIAEELQISINTVKSLKKSSFDKLRNMLSKDELIFLFMLCRE